MNAPVFSIAAIVIGSFMMQSCTNQDAMPDRMNDDKVTFDKDGANPDPGTISGKPVNRLIWKEYKRKGAKSLSDTLPIADCSIEIEGNHFKYTIAQNLKYADELIIDTTYNYPVFSFKNHRHDKLHFLKKDSSEIVLKRFNDEGDYEFFKKEPFRN